MSIIIGSQPSSHTLRFSEEDHDSQIGLLRLDEAGASLVGTGSGATVVIGKKEDGSYVATYQVIVSNLPPAAAEHIGSRKEIKYNIAGLIDVIGYLVPTSSDLGVHLNILGSAVGTFYGQANGGGLVIELTLRLVSGSLKFYVQETELRVNYSLRGGAIEGDEKVA